ncbi:MAG: hypothetical protein KDD48_02640 [Bdellovibrionales bacterium]|nr:hypothetical protein [Bdellovibrionales bacterium]
MIQMVNLFCLSFSMGITLAMLLIKRDDMVVSFFRNTALVALGLYSVFMFFSWKGQMAFYWPGMILLCYGATIHLLLPLVSKVLLFTAGTSLLYQCYDLLSSIKTNGYISYLEFTSIMVGALMMGMSVVAMNVGHSYLSSIKLKMDPLKVSVGALFVLIVLRWGLFFLGLYQLGVDQLMSAVHSMGIHDVTKTAILLSRILFGLVGPSVLVVLVWQTVKIGSTQSATGILYALLSMVLIGELCADDLLLHSIFWF